jgi:uncharacterized integral membrane protein (TIGR00698 family)
MSDIASKFALHDDLVRPAVYARNLSPDAFLSLGSMEGLFEAVVAPRAAAPPTHWAKLAPGYVLSIGVACLAYALHELPFAPFTIVGVSGVRHPVGPAIIAVILGLLIRNTLTLPDAFKAGCKSAIRTYIPVAIVLTGGGLNLAVISTVGAKALAVIVVCISMALVGGYYIGRLCGLTAKTSLLIGAGTAICGNSAIVATAPLIDAEDDDIVLSIGTVNLFGLLAMLVWPLVGGWLSLTSETFGMWAGTTIHAVPQVVAAGFAYSSEAGTLATLVKLVRVACLAPMVFLLAILHTRRHADDNGNSLTIRYARLVPWFVWGFLILSLANTAGLLPVLSFSPVNPFMSRADQPFTVPVAAACTFLANLLLTMDMAAIGLEVNLRQLVAVGGQALLAGLLSTVGLGLGGLILLALLF